MNVSCINRTVVGACFRELTMEPSLRKFFSIIAADGLQEAYKNKSIVTWLNTLNYDPDTIKKYLVQGIGINLRTVLKIARQYARILENYPPDQEGKIRQQFNYLTLVSLVKQVFEQHVDPKNLDISTKGVKITLGFWNFFAKVESGRLFMFHAKTRPISSNREVSVGQVYDLVSQQRLILKWANNPKTGEIISREVNNLRAIHARADYEGIDLDWMQDLPLATFKRDDFFAFIGVKYGKDLFSVMNVDLPNAQRARLCKMIVRAYAKTRELQFWNGDIKSDNIVYHGEKIVFIDWAGARSLYPQVEKFKRPLSRTPLYANPDLLHKMEAIIDEYKESGANDQLKEEFIQTAEALELFSVGVTLFNVLTCRWPFLLVYDFRYEANLPFPSGGFEKKSWDIFLKKKYDPAIVQTMKVMLDPSDPITPTEAIAMWESIK